MSSDHDISEYLKYHGKKRYTIILCDMHVGGNIEIDRYLTKEEVDFLARTIGSHRIMEEVDGVWRYLSD